MKITDINPEAAEDLKLFRATLPGSFERQLAATALQETARRHRIATQLARRRHTRRPRVELA